MPLLPYNYGSQVTSSWGSWCCTGTGAAGIALIAEAAGIALVAEAAGVALIAGAAGIALVAGAAGVGTFAPGAGPVQSIFTHRVSLCTLYRSLGPKVSRTRRPRLKIRFLTVQVNTESATTNTK